MVYLMIFLPIYRLLLISKSIIILLVSSGNSYLLTVCHFSVWVRTVQYTRLYRQTSVQLWYCSSFLHFKVALNLSAVSDITFHNRTVEGWKEYKWWLVRELGKRNLLAGPRALVSSGIGISISLWKSVSSSSFLLHYKKSTVLKCT